MRVLVACEFSGVVREALRRRGHSAWSCDLLPTEIPGNHIEGDVLEILDQGWDLMIAHPPCTYLSYAGNVWLKQPGRFEKREEAMEFFMALANASIPRIAIENPVGYPQKAWRKPDQVIHPYHFGHPMRKATCLWLKNLPMLMHPEVEPPPPHRIDGVTGRNRHWVDSFPGGNIEKRRRERSRTFQGIAEAIAEQWSPGEIAIPVNCDCEACCRTKNQQVTEAWCHSGFDGECSWADCPQRANYQTYCPLAVADENEDSR